VEPDPEALAIVERLEAELSQQLDVTIATLAAPLDSRSSVVRSEEAAIGNLVADAIRHATGAQIAITNGGSLRGNRTYPAGYAFTRRDVLSELPFGNRTVLVEITGRDVKAALENGVSDIDNRSGRFPQVSGVRMTVDRRVPAGGRITRLEHNGKPVEPDARYKVASNDFLLSGGDGYTTLAHGRTLIGKTDGRLLADIVMSYVRSLKTVDAKVEGRIVFA
jgi:2',3'-cyclic-nucleotide 2'-phosphodiesterase (5'-nucleotidase family)